MSFERYYIKNQLKPLIDQGLLEAGDYSYGNPTILHYGESTKVMIGKFCSISSNVYIFLGGNHRHDWVTTYPFSAPELHSIWPEAAHITGHPASRGNVVIGNDVWIGHGVTIASGVEIGDGAVIGSMAVVTKSVRPYAIVAGNPAKELRRRFDDATIAQLLELKWWNWPIEKIRANMTQLLSPDLPTLLEQH